MKKLITLALLMMVAATTMFAQNYKKGNYAGTGGSPHEVVKGKNVNVSYGRPYKKGRDIFGGLEAYGKVWRAGADEATEITFEKDATFGGKKIAAGTYTMFVIPNKKEWAIILNSQLGQWGAYGYEKAKDKDVLKVTAPVNPLNEVVDQFTISFSNGAMTMAWDKTSVSVPINF